MICENATNGAELSGRRGRFVVRYSWVVAALLLGACSSVPDSLNPAKWYEEVDTALHAPPDQIQADNQDKTYPNLAEVPPRPEPPTVAERKQIADGLVADRANASYIPDTLRHDIDPSTSLPPPTFTSTTPQNVIATEPITGTPQVGDVQPGVGDLPAAQPGYYATQAQKSAATTNQQAPAFDLPLPGVNSTYQPKSPPGVLSATAPAPQRVQKTAELQPIEPEPDPVIPAPPGVPNQPAPPAAAPAARTPGSNQVAALYYDLGSATLAADDRTVLGQVAELYRLQGGHLRIIGHATTLPQASIKDSLADLKLAGERADGVAAALIKLGVPAGSIERQAVTAADPAIDTNPAVGRRTEIYLDY
jgi:outer membrane protein OmpA-like peptidoglycan-associated protein